MSFACSSNGTRPKLWRRISRHRISPPSQNYCRDSWRPRRNSCAMRLPEPDPSTNRVFNYTGPAFPVVLDVIIDPAGWLGFGTAIDGNVTLPRPSIAPHGAIFGDRLRGRISGIAQRLPQADKAIAALGE